MPFRFRQTAPQHRFPPHSLCQLPAFLIAYIARRRADQAGYGVFFHVFCHVDANDVAFIIKQGASANALASSVFPTPVGPKNRNEPMGRLGSCIPPESAELPPLPALPLPLGPNNALMQNLIQIQQLFTFAFHQLGNRYTCPPSMIRAISSSVTLSRSKELGPWLSSASFSSSDSCFCRLGSSPYFSSAARFRS